MPKPPSPLLSVRAVVVLLLSLTCGVTGGVLTYFAGSNTPAAILARLMSTAGSIIFLHKEVK